MPSFEERLWAELVEHHGAALAAPPARGPARRSPRARLRVRTAAGLATAAAALAAALVLVLGGIGPGSGPAAYAVVRNPDGTVTVTIREIVGVTGATARLEALGVPARVVGVRPGCGSRGFTPARLPPQASHGIARIAGGAGHAAIVLDPAAIPAGDTVLVGVEPFGGGPRGESEIGLSVGVFRGPAPPCVAPLVH